MRRVVLVLLVALLHSVLPQQFNYDPKASIRISEMMSHTANGGFQYVEVVNIARVNVELDGWTLSIDNSSQSYNFSGILPPGGVHVTPPNAVYMPSTGFTAHLSHLGVSIQNVTVAASAIGVTYSRFVDPATNREHYAQAYSTYGFTNRYPRVGPFVISEINFNPPPGLDEFIKIKNVASTWQRFRAANTPEPWLVYISSRAAFDGKVPHNTQNHALILPMDSWLAPGEEAYVVPIATRDFRIKYQIDPEVNVFGPYRKIFSLGDARGLVQLAIQDAMPILIDEVNYRIARPWPTNATAIYRISERSYADNPSNWRFPNQTLTCTNTSDCHFIDNCTVPHCDTATSRCLYFVRVCNDTNYPVCFPNQTCDRNITPNISATYSCALANPAPCVNPLAPRNNDPLVRPPQAARLSNVAPLGRATMVPDIGNTSSWGIDGNYRDGFKVDNSTAESARNVTNPTYTITLNRDYSSFELRTIRMWNRFDELAISWNYPYTVQLLTSNGTLLLSRNFTAITGRGNESTWYPRINSIIISNGTFPPGEFLRTIVITGPGVNRRLSFAEVQVMAFIPINCTMSAWLGWSPCVDGMRTRQRIPLRSEANGGAPCPALRREQVPCNATTTTGNGNSSVPSGINATTTGVAPVIPTSTTGHGRTPVLLTATFKIKIKSEPTNCTVVISIANSFRRNIVRKLSTSFGVFTQSRIEVSITNVSNCSYTAHNKRNVEETQIPVSVGVADSSLPGEPPSSDVLLKIEKNLPDITAAVANETNEVVPGSQSDFAATSPPATSPVNKTIGGISVWIWIVIAAIGVLLFIIIIIAIAIKVRKNKEERV